MQNDNEPSRGPLFRTYALYRKSLPLKLTRLCWPRYYSPSGVSVLIRIFTNFMRMYRHTSLLEIADIVSLFYVPSPCLNCALCPMYVRVCMYLFLPHVKEDEPVSAVTSHAISRITLTVIYTTDKFAYTHTYNHGRFRQVRSHLLLRPLGLLKPYSLDLWLGS